MLTIEKDHYTSRGIAEQIPAELQRFLWSILEKEREDHPADYLQVLMLQMEHEGSFSITYSQDMPMCQHTYQLTDVRDKLPEHLQEVKIFVVDSITSITMMFAEEY